MTLPTLQYNPVLKKTDFFPRYFRGEFGNGSPTWLTLQEFCSSPVVDRGLYHLRNGRVAGGVTYYKQTRQQVIERWSKVSDPEGWYCSEQVPERVEKSLLLQGEVLEMERGLSLYYTRVAKPMREALAECASSVFGIISVCLLRRFLCPNSYEWLRELLGRYPGHVVEFSSYGYRWGTLANFNTVFWEVRKY